MLRGLEAAATPSVRDNAVAARDDELLSLVAIFPDTCTHTLEEEAMVYRLDVPPVDGVPGTTVLEVLVPIWSAYPATPPLAVVRNEAVPAYIRLVALARLNAIWAETPGECCVFRLLEWASSDFARLVAAPPPLVSLRPDEASTPPPLPGPLGPAPAPPRQSSGRRGGEDVAAVPMAAASLRGSKHRPSRPPLPVDKLRDAITTTVRRSPVVVISGATGCGKTTQVRARSLARVSRAVTSRVETINYPPHLLCPCLLSSSHPLCCSGAPVHFGRLGGARRACWPPHLHPAAEVVSCWREWRLVV